MFHILSLLMARLIWRYVRNVIYRLNFESQSSWMVYNLISVEILVFKIFAIYQYSYQFFEPSGANLKICKIYSISKYFTVKTLKTTLRWIQIQKTLNIRDIFLGRGTVLISFVVDRQIFYINDEGIFIHGVNFDHLKVLFHSVLLVWYLI